MSESLHNPPFQIPAPESLNPLFTGYTFEKILGVGGMGAVYKARQDFFNRDVAIKLLLSKTFGEEEFFRQFFAEAQSMAVLEHPNLLKIYDYGEMNGMLYIIMEYVEGSSLHDAIDGQSVEPLQTAQILLPVCEGLAHAHESQILHRDIKPENILLDQFCTPKVSDFGLARDAMDTSLEEVIWGSLGYIAPEVVHAPESVDERTDIYALGCVMYSMLTAMIPDPNQPDFTPLQRLDQRFSYILSRTMNPDMNQRYSSMNEMAADLRDLILSLEEMQSNGMVTNY